jgi:phosphoribosylformylglycinamidine synthase
VDKSLHRSLGLTDEEANVITEILGRQANPLELAMYSVMWSEHCSYKSSRLHLKRLPTEAPWVLVGPGENAGVVDVGDEIAVAIRIESHNHPSAIEPYQGAATGVGGILRDIFTMGARPIALMDPLRFGPLDDPKSQWIAEGVVSGVSGYGNAVGVPTVGGETVFDSTYKENPLVNVLCLGVLPTDRLVLGQASGIGNLAVLLGNSTGRDGIGGVSVLASAGFSEEDDSAKRPSVQVGDPYEEKRLIEACLALLDEKLVIGIQDLGGAGLTCATSETASRGGVGMDVDISAIPCRELGMEPYEIMTSESQERMLAIVEPKNLKRVLEISNQWEVQASVIGKVTNGDSLRILSETDGEVLADIPASSLHDDAPLYDRPKKKPELHQGLSGDELNPPVDTANDLLSLLFDPSWVYEQYDHQLFLNTVVGPGDDATVLRLKHPVSGKETGRGLAITTDGNHRWCLIDPKIGTAMIVAEAVLNLACVGARPLAVVNCLNFGNPEHPEVMWQLSEAIDGMSDACVSFGVPVIGGNVSLYNESEGNNIAPTPVIGMLGLIDDLKNRPPGAQMAEGDRLLLIGPETSGLGGSLWATNHGALYGELPELDLEMHLKVAETIRTLVETELIRGVHDLSEGGLGVALAEMAAKSSVGVSIARTPNHQALFGEGPSRAVVAVDPESLTEVLTLCEERGVPVVRLGLATGNQFKIKDMMDVSLSDLKAAFISKLPNTFGVGTSNQ